MGNTEEAEKNQKANEPERFEINVKAGKDKKGIEQVFTFSGPVGASLGLTYDAAYRVVSEVLAHLQREVNRLKPKDIQESGKKKADSE